MVTWITWILSLVFFNLWDSGVFSLNLDWTKQLSKQMEHSYPSKWTMADDPTSDEVKMIFVSQSGWMNSDCCIKKTLERWRVWFALTKSLDRADWETDLSVSPAEVKVLASTAKIFQQQQRGENASKQGQCDYVSCAETTLPSQVASFLTTRSAPSPLRLQKAFSGCPRLLSQINLKPFTANHIPSPETHLSLASSHLIFIWFNSITHSKNSIPNHPGSDLQMPNRMEASRRNAPVQPMIPIYIWEQNEYLRIVKSHAHEFHGKPGQTEKLCAFGPRFLPTADGKIIIGYLLRNSNLPFGINLAHPKEQFGWFPCCPRFEKNAVIYGYLFVPTSAESPESWARGRLSYCSHRATYFSDPCQTADWSQ